AVALADQAMAANPDVVFVRLRGQMYLADGDAASAVRLLEQASGQDRNHYVTQFMLAQAYAAVGRKADADRANARATEIRTDYDRATELSRQATANPWDPVIRDRLAEYWDRVGDAKAAAMWRKAAAEIRSQRRSADAPG